MATRVILVTDDFCQLIAHDTVTQSHTSSYACRIVQISVDDHAFPDPSLFGCLDVFEHSNILLPACT